MISIYTSIVELPESWNAIAVNNIFLSKNYLEVLEKTAPTNIKCYFIGFFNQDELVGIALLQFINLNQLTSFGARDRSIKTTIRNAFFKKLSSRILIIGNTMLSGQNGFLFSDAISKPDSFIALQNAAQKLKLILKSEGLQEHIITYKDILQKDLTEIDKKTFQNHFQFSAQPNMIFKIPTHWQTEQDYINALSKKYRDQYKRARKKAKGIEKKKMELEDILRYKETIYDLYLYVAKNAYFNTFFLHKDHFSQLKKSLQENFLFYGYFIDDTLIGFNTLIKNGSCMDTYFLGYDEKIQQSYMLYLNMLYDMIAYSINQGFDEIVFGRTALEIKSSVGAVPFEMQNFAIHNNSIANLAFATVYSYLEPKAVWTKRNPFKVID